MIRPRRLGLRAQIVFALSTVFLLSFALLGAATLRLTVKAERNRALGLSADLVASVLAREPDPARALPAIASALESRVPLAAAVIKGPDGIEATHGVVPAEPGITVALDSERELTLWLKRTAVPPHLPLANLLLFYVGLTGLAVMLFAYGALTLLVVRPLDALTRQSELLAAGTARLEVPTRGAAEVVRLAAALNAMADQLRAERRTLETRLSELEARTLELKTTEQQLIHGEKLASVGRLAAGVAHEIGNPLAAILGLVELLRAGDLPHDEADEFLARIHRETERIHGIIGDLLDFSRGRPDDEVPDQSADLRDAIADAVNLVRPQKASKKVALEVFVSDELGRVAAPQHRLTQVLLNLLLNAVDALGGEGEIRIDARPSAEGVCLLSITDNGPGIPVSIEDTLFEPFTTTKPAGNGTGLGLAVCHALVGAMGGSISARNLEGGGACFEIRLDTA